MNKICHRFSRLAAGSLSAFALAACFSVSGFARAADLESGQAVAAALPCNPDFGGVFQYDHGVQTSVAAHPSGLFIEFHQSEE
jgi:hypothetical protein